MRIIDPLYKYPGGKRSELRHLFQFIPSFRRYCEPFFGGGALFFRLGGDPIRDGTSCHINDLDADVYTFLTVLKDFRQTLIEELCTDRYEVSDARYLWLRDNFTPSSDVERAARFYCLRQCAYRGIIRKSPSGRSTVSFGRKEAHPRHPKYDLFAQRLVTPGKRFLNLDGLKNSRIDKLLKLTTVTREDFEWALEQYQDDPSTFVFCDPPYLDCEAGYAQPFKTDDHERLAAVIRRVKCQCMVVVSSTPLTEHLYEGLIVHRYQKKYSMRIEDAAKPVEHLVACNYRPPPRRVVPRLFS